MNLPKLRLNHNVLQVWTVNAFETKTIKIMKRLIETIKNIFSRKPLLATPVVRQRKTSYNLIIIRNKDLSYTAKVKLNNKKWYQNKIYSIYYVPNFLRPLKHYNDFYYITISNHRRGQTSIYFNVILQMLIDFKRQYKISEKCGVAIYAA